MRSVRANKLTAEKVWLVENWESDTFSSVTQPPSTPVASPAYTLSVTEKEEKKEEKEEKKEEKDWSWRILEVGLGGSEMVNIHWWTATNNLGNAQIYTIFSYCGAPLILEWFVSNCILVCF